VAKTGLGRGLDSLIPTEIIQEQLRDNAANQIASLEVSKIVPNPHQPRMQFDEVSIAELGESLEQHGLIQPVVVVEAGNNVYQLIAGERRWRAAKKIGWKKIDAVVRSADEQKQAQLALIENIQRDDLHVLEVAGAFVKLIEQFNFDFASLSKSTGKAETTIRNMIRLLVLPEKAKKALLEGNITEGHARQVLAAPQKHQDKLVELIITKKWSVRQAEQYVKGLKTDDSAKQALSKTASQNKITRTLQKSLGLKVRQKNMAKGGRIVIDFKSDEDLQKIVERLG